MQTMQYFFKANYIVCNENLVLAILTIVIIVRLDDHYDIA